VCQTRLFAASTTCLCGLLCKVLQAVDELLMRESDPSGERYSLSKILHTCQVR
jgi:hypothetical protein